MLATAASDLSTGYGAYLVQTTLALVAVCALAVVVLRLMRRRFTASARGMRVVARLVLEPRRTIYVVEVAGRFLVLGVGDGPMALVTELDPARAAELERGESEAPGWLDLLRRALVRGTPGGPGVDGRAT